MKAVRGQARENTIQISANDILDMENQTLLYEPRISKSRGQSWEVKENRHVGVGGRSGTGRKRLALAPYLPYTGCGGDSDSSSSRPVLQCFVMGYRDSRL